LPGAGLALTAVDIGYDVHMGKAVISGVGGVVMAAGPAWPSAPWSLHRSVRAPARSSAGAGMLTSGALDAAYDRLAPGTRAAIEGGFHAIGHGVEAAVEAVGRSASTVWHSIF
jgi:hypothetical protein